MPQTDSVLTALGQNVRQTREIKQLTQEKLAEFAGLDPTYLSGIERGLYSLCVGWAIRKMDVRQNLANQFRDLRVSPAVRDVF